MTLIYLAHPIDRSNQRVRNKINDARQMLSGGGLPLQGHHVYRPQDAFVLGSGVKIDGSINAINREALEQAGAMLALWPEESKSWGMPVEVDRAVTAGKPVVLVSEEPTTWAMHSDGQVLVVTPEDGEAWPELVKRGLRELLARLGELAIRQEQPGLWFTVTPTEVGIQTSPNSDIYRQAVKEKLLVASEGSVDYSGYAKAWGGSESTEDPTEPQGEVQDSGGYSRLLRGELPVQFKRQDFPNIGPCLPTRAHPDDAGLDLFVSEDVEIGPSEFVDIPTNLGVQLPEGTWGFLVGRSSTLRKKGLLVNPGVIDVGYTGELFSGVWNLTGERVKVHAGERVAQLIVLPNLTETLVPVSRETLVETARGARGFGSSGS